MGLLHARFLNPGEMQLPLRHQIKPNKNKWLAAKPSAILCLSLRSLFRVYIVQKFALDVFVFEFP